MTLAQINTLDRTGFVAALGGVFEHSPWVADRAYDARPFASADALHAAMMRIVDDARREDIGREGLDIRGPELVCEHGHADEDDGKG